jgi:uncharacterized MnhB-related membrane protein
MILLILSIPLLVFSAIAVYHNDLLVSVLCLAAASLNIALLYLILQAPDIAITEAAVNAGLTTLIFVIAIKKTRREE